MKIPRVTYLHNRYDAYYQPGALWKTRSRVAAKDAHWNSKTFKVIYIPRGEWILLLKYVSTIHTENIKFLWREKVLYASDVDVGLHFWIDVDNPKYKT